MKPPFLKRGQTYRQWKSQKRRELKVLEKALVVLNRGSAYVPLYENVWKIRELIDQLKEELSVERWGR